MTAVAHLFYAPTVKTIPEQENYTPPRKLVRATRIAELADVSTRCVYLWFRDDIIPGYRISNSIRFDEEEVMKVIKERNS